MRDVRGSFVISIEAPDVFGWADEAADEIERLKAYAKYMDQENERAAGRIKKLEAVVEAAKEYIEADGSITQERLDKALAAAREHG